MKLKYHVIFFIMAYALATTTLLLSCKCTNNRLVCNLHYVGITLRIFAMQRNREDEDIIIIMKNVNGMHNL